MSNLKVDNDGMVAIVTIERPQQLNALNKDTISELSHVLDQIESDSNVRVVIITGSGEKAFVAGADIKEFAHFSPQEGQQLSAEGHKQLFDKLEKLNKPVIAAVNGFALGGGLELAMSAHIRIASENAQLGLPEVTLGVIPGYGGTQRLAQLVGKGKAIEMIVSGQFISAADAHAWGLVNQVVSLENLMPTALKLAQKIARNSPVAIGSALRSVLAGYKDGVNGFETEIKEFGNCFGKDDFMEGTTAFLEKRKPAFKG
jgi:enoyl-CoA hydratase